MIRQSLLPALLAAGLFTSPIAAWSADAASDVAVVDPYARAVPPVVPNSAAFMTLQNGGGAAHRLVGARSDAAQTVELHTHIDDGGVMRMRQIPAIDIPAGGETRLQPGGLHLMLIGLHKPLMPGETVALDLEFADGSDRRLEIPVREIQMGDMPHHHHH